MSVRRVHQRCRVSGQSQYHTAAPCARQLGAQRACAEGEFYQVVQIGGRNANFAQQIVVFREEGAELVGIVEHVLDPTSEVSDALKHRIDARPARGDSGHQCGGVSL